MQIVVFGEDWGRHPSSTQHLFYHLKSHHDVVWVNSIGLRRPRLNWRDISRAVNKLASWWKQHSPHENENISKSGKNFKVVQPLALPWPGSSLAAKINRLLLSRQLRHHLCPEQPVILWCSLPSAVDLVGQFNELAVIYYCGDDFSGLSGVDHDPVTAMELNLVAKADYIYAASQDLAGKFPATKTEFLPHGVNFELFSQAMPRPRDLPDNPFIAGFYGSVADWLDIKLIRAAAIALPHWQFVFIGTIQTDVSLLEDLKNVHFLGPKPHHLLPAYVQHWQASLLPFLRNRQIISCNPLKLLEYMAVGKPIVSTRFPAVEKYEEHVAVTDSVEDFINGLSSIESHTTVTDSQNALKEISHEMSWQKFADRIRLKINELVQN